MTTVLLAYCGYALIGLVAGVLSGLLGVGGGVVMVPSLTLLLAQQQIPWQELLPVVAATTLAVIALNSLCSLIQHARSGQAIWDVYSKLFVGLISGVAVGVTLGMSLDASLLRMLFGLFLLLVAAMLLTDFQPEAQRELPGRWGLSSVYFLVGLKSGLFSLGGGLISTPYLLYCNVPIKRACAITCAISATMAITGILCFAVFSLVSPSVVPYTFGHVYMPAFLGIGLVSPIATRLGIRWVDKVSVTNLKRLLAGLVLLAVAKLLFS